jgi:uncharacterized membrane protein
MLRLTTFWTAIRDSLWFIPAAFTLTAAAVAIGLVKFEASHDVTRWEGGHWLIGGSVDGARAVLSTIAGSVVTVTGVVFSVTIVALQLASSQFTPRILRSFIADRSNQLVLGVFIATFTYTLLVLRVVRSIEEGEEFVPQLAVSLSIVLSLVSIGFLIHFIHHAARSMQASVILDRLAGEALDQVRRLFPVEIGESNGAASTAEEFPSGRSQVVVATSEGYLRAVDSKALFNLGESQKLTVAMVPEVGAFILEGTPLAHVWADGRLLDEVHQQVRRAFVLGPERTPEQDVGFVLLEISDMAVKSLSPGINDPTTAEHCIDRLAQILLALGKRRPPEPLRTEAGQLHFIARPLTFDAALEIAFGQVLHFGRETPTIVRKVQRTLESLQELLSFERREPLRALSAKLEDCVVTDRRPSLPAQRGGVRGGAN